MWDYISSKPAIGALRCQWCVRLAHASAKIHRFFESGFRQRALNVESAPTTRGFPCHCGSGAKRRKQTAGAITNAPLQHQRPERGILLLKKVEAGDNQRC